MVYSGIVLVVDDDAVDRDHTTAILQQAGFDTRVLSGADAAMALSPDDPDAPAVVVLDVSLEGITGYEVCRRLRDAHGDEMGIIFVSGERTDPIDRVAGLLLGADDYLAKPFDPDELTARVLSLLRRKGAGSGARMNGSANGIGASGNGTNGNRPGDHATRPYQLTERELEVLRLLADGLDQAEVARDLFVSTTTVATHIQRILGKLHVHNRAQAVALAHREGLVR
jgi:DNA-binding NarL/FixJ family response regulator